LFFIGLDLFFIIDFERYFGIFGNFELDSLLLGIEEGILFISLFISIIF
jgi:hypothetical protein